MTTGRSRLRCGFPGVANRHVTDMPGRPFYVLKPDLAGVSVGVGHIDGAGQRFVLCGLGAHEWVACQTAPTEACVHIAHVKVPGRPVILVGPEVGPECIHEEGCG